MPDKDLYEGDLVHIDRPDIPTGDYTVHGDSSGHYVTDADGVNYDLGTEMTLDDSGDLVYAGVEKIDPLEVDSF